MITLAEICSVKREHIAACKARVSEAALMRQAHAQTAPRGFYAALNARKHQGKIGLIAELKKASPSKGLIRADFYPETMARAYEKGGATCLSVLTDVPYFQGQDDYLARARDAVSLPVLRKDFMLDIYQIVESRALGADCILLIMAALDDAMAKEMEGAARALGMDALIEVHDRTELERALTHLSSPLIGINNRNLKTMAVDLATSEILAKHLPPHILAVCESGIAAPRDIERMRKASISCFLVGESLMREADVSQAVKTLLGVSHG